MSSTANIAALSLTKDEEQGWEQLKKAGSIAITSHIHPDGDAIGSCLALASFCQHLGKPATVVIDDRISEIYSFLAGYDSIMDMESIVGCSVPYDMLVILDANPSRIGRAKNLEAGATLCIDHHATNPRLCDYNIVREGSSSTAEILYKLLALGEYDIDADMAACLYTGLVTDAVFFKAPSVRRETFLIAAELAALGVKTDVIAEHLEEKTFEELRWKAKALTGVKLYMDAKIAGVCLDAEYDELELTDSIIDEIRYLRSVEIAFLLKHEADGTYRVRLRSKTYDVSVVAKKNHGGGHKDAAGFTIQAEDIQGAERLLLEELRGFLAGKKGAQA